MTARPRLHLLVATAVLLITSGCTGIVSNAAPTSTADTEPPVIRFAVVGDSLSAGSTGVLLGDDGTGSWIEHAESPGIDFVGGIARGGATSTSIAQEIVGTPPRVDVLVILLGTNNVSYGLPDSALEPDLVAIADAFAPDAVLVAEIPPNDSNPERADAVRVLLAQIAERQGWSHTDPWSSLRDGLRWSAGMTYDGTHPTPEATAAAGSALRQAIIAAAA